MRPSHIRRCLVAALALCAACEPEPPAAIPCNRNLDCPAGLVCSDGVCRAAAARDAGVDAAALDAAFADGRVDAAVGADRGAALWGALPPGVTAASSSRYRLRGELRAWGPVEMSSGRYRLRLTPTLAR